MQHLLRSWLFLSLLGRCGSDDPSCIGKNKGSDYVVIVSHLKADFWLRHLIFSIKCLYK